MLQCTKCAESLNLLLYMATLLYIFCPYPDFPNISLDHLKHQFGLVKGYLCYKTITSQNVSSEAQIQNFSIS